MLQCKDLALEVQRRYFNCGLICIAHCTMLTLAKCHHWASMVPLLGTIDAHRKIHACTCHSSDRCSCTLVCKRILMPWNFELQYSMSCSVAHACAALNKQQQC